jgi:small subunit ribosomal protein S20
MPTHKSAEKRMRQGERKRVINKANRTSLRREIKSYREMESGEPSKAKYPTIASTIDRAAKKGIIHPRKASRLKSRLSRKTVKA